jgi:endogenous inhibitor of DNA gyrase (YacG/DUF329 family)
MNSNITQKQCTICGKELSGRQSKFCSRICKNQDGNNKFQNYKAQKKRSKDRKLNLIKKLGGCCSKCGYFRNIAALCFHHLYDKDFALDARRISNSNLEKLETEVSKCILLCHNCHMEEHHPDFNQ